jgi:outer membrane protein W
MKEHLLHNIHNSDQKKKLKKNKILPQAETCFTTTNLGRESVCLMKKIHEICRGQTGKFTAVLWG